MIYHVAPGETGYNLLSKRHVFRAVILNGLTDDKNTPVKGPMVLEAKDGSYYHEIEFRDAIKDGKHLVFEFQVRFRKKEYFCYIKDASRKFKWDLLPMNLFRMDEIDPAHEQDQKTNG